MSAPENMNDEQKYCYRMLCDMMGGRHHINGKVRTCNANGISVSLYHGWATFDSYYLTKAVILAHDRCVRIELSSSAPGMIKFRLHKRKGRKGPGDSIWDYHPTIEDAIKRVRAGYGEPV